MVVGTRYASLSTHAICLLRHMLWQDLHLSLRCDAVCIAGVWVTVVDLVASFGGGHGGGATHYSLFFSFLFFDNFLMLLKEGFEISGNPHNSTIDCVDARLNGFFVLGCHIPRHLTSCRLDFLLIDLNLSQGIFDLDVEL